MAHQVPSWAAAQHHMAATATPRGANRAQPVVQQRPAVGSSHSMPPNPRSRAQSTVSSSGGGAKDAAAGERDKNRMLLQNTAKQEKVIEGDMEELKKQLMSDFSELHDQLVAEQQEFAQDMETARVRSENNRQRLDQEKVEMQGMKQALAQELESARTRSEQNRRDLDSEKASIVSMQQQIKANRAELDEEKREMKSMKQSITQDVAAVSKLKQELTTLKQEAGDAKKNTQAMVAMKQELAEVKQHKPELQQLKDLKPEMSNMKKQVSEVKQLKQDVEQIKKLKQDVEKLQKDIQESKSLKPEIAKLKEGLKSNDELVRLKSQADLTNLEFKDLQKKLYDSGVLAPTRDEPVPEESPPVGTIELAEDIFTARLLLRLGFMKGNCSDESVQREASEQREFRRGYGEVDSDESEKPNFDEVTGIVVPEVEEGGWAYVEVTTGWVFICLSTIFVQLLILAIMMRSYIKAAQGKCFDGDDLSWWLLHLSRCMATIVAGGLMAKELMDTVNYWMISELLEPHMSCEVVLTTFMRLVMQVLIIVASVFLFMSSNDPAETWMNMTALGFIATLGQDILEVAKRGVFGHHIQGTITGLNYQLNLEHDYPSWFSTVRYMTLLLSVVGIVSISTWIFIREDPHCDDHSHHVQAVANLTTGLVASGGQHHR